ncbi:thioesterase II family protein [Micromonospora sp. C28ISP2-4]|uniref:thioesterase II family protein n=1 Tax=Micromonospora TaxID=1873 RepID=UPI00267610CB|nr:thioesterase domain-containing protein [Micromonospora sp. C28ISP2-4]MDO3685990.1 thioesterase domain-containing protein [Micromonospora sp. C28ISP2-4]
MPNQRNQWLPREPSAGVSGRVFLIPYSGCGASMYRRWPPQHDGVDLLPVELPGHETRLAEPNFETYQELAKLMVAGLEPYLDLPYAFFGHCGSALAAYEVSSEIIRAGLPQPARVYISSQVAPQDGPFGRFLQMTDEELAEELATLSRQLGAEPNPALISFYVEVLREDVETNKRYVVPDPFRLTCPITAIGWTEDVEIRHDTMGGWASCGETTFELLPGPHHRFIEAPPDLLRVLCDGLGRAG